VVVEDGYRGDHYPGVGKYDWSPGVDEEDNGGIECKSHKRIHILAIRRSWLSNWEKVEWFFPESRYITIPDISCHYISVTLFLSRLTCGTVPAIHLVDTNRFTNQVEQESQDEADHEDANSGLWLELVHRPGERRRQHGTDNSSFDKDIHGVT
jgi:hypothetical protein